MCLNAQYKHDQGMLIKKSLHFNVKSTILNILSLLFTSKFNLNIFLEKNCFFNLHTVKQSTYHPKEPF